MKPSTTMIAACRVPPSLEARRLGAWEIRHFRLADYAPVVGLYYQTRNGPLNPYDSWTCLFRDTLATRGHEMGECVMEDTPSELRRHLPVLLAGRGRVLVSGLGLGCVVRGLLAKPSVEHIDVVEIDPHILALVGGEFAGSSRLTLHQGDAETFDWPASTRWDFAWHDVWSETESLDVVHARMLARYRDRCGRQGAWEMARCLKRVWPDPLVNATRRRRVAA